jgi:hypothetical protein
MDGGSIARPLLNTRGIWRLARLAANSIAEQWQRRRGDDGRTSELAPVDHAYTESTSQTDYVRRVLTELEEEWHAFDRADRQRTPRLS